MNAEIPRYDFKRIYGYNSCNPHISYTVFLLLLHFASCTGLSKFLRIFPSLRMLPTFHTYLCRWKTSTAAVSYNIFRSFYCNITRLRRITLGLTYLNNTASAENRIKESRGRCRKRSFDIALMHTVCQIAVR